MMDRSAILQRLERLRCDESFALCVASIKPGKFLRDPDDPQYRQRSIYTAELRRFVYNAACFNEILLDQELKERFFRIFGYPGSLEFTIYPNSWLRDLPLLDLGRGAYLADGIVLGTNQVTPDQRNLMVGCIRIGADCIFDQQCMVGYGVTVGTNVKVGIQCLIGIKSSLGANSVLKVRSQVGHGCEIGCGVVLGYSTAIGNFSVVEDGVELPDHTVVPPFSRVARDGIAPRKTKARDV